MANAEPIGILGGTFDPVHYGHLRPALEILEALELAQIRFIPCRQPPHRENPVADPQQRLAMVQRAVSGQPGFVVDDCELRRDGPSYMVDTLTALRDEVGAVPLCLLLGVDAFNGLHRWHRWQAIPQLAHLIVLYRPGFDLHHDAAPAALAGQRTLRHPAELRDYPAGGVLFQPVTQLAISATHIRELLMQGHNPRYLLPDSVLSLIYEQRLYRS